MVSKQQVFNQMIQGCQDRSNLLLLKAMVLEVQRMDRNFIQVLLHFKQLEMDYKVDQIFVLSSNFQLGLQNQSSQILLTQLALPLALQHLLPL